MWDLIGSSVRAWKELSVHKSYLRIVMENRPMSSTNYVGTDVVMLSFLNLLENGTKKVGFAVLPF